MGTVAVLGEEALLRGYQLAGAVALPADTPDQVRDVWSRLAADVLVVVLTPAAAASLASYPIGPDGPMTVVMPE